MWIFLKIYRKLKIARKSYQGCSVIYLNIEVISRDAKLKINPEIVKMFIQDVAKIRDGIFIWDYLFIEISLVDYDATFYFSRCNYLLCIIIHSVLLFAFWLYLCTCSIPSRYKLLTLKLLNKQLANKAIFYGNRNRDHCRFTKLVNIIDQSLYNY